MHLDFDEATIITGVELIDKQHLKYFYIVNHFLEHLDDREKSRSLFTDLNGYVIYHFGTEEELMDKYHYDMTEEHKKQHQYFKETIKELTFSYLNGDDFDEKTKSAIGQMLIDWFVNHIQNVDKRLCEFILHKSRIDQKFVEKLKSMLHLFSANHG